MDKQADFSNWSSAARGDSGEERGGVGGEYMRGGSVTNYLLPGMIQRATKQR